MTDVAKLAKELKVGDVLVHDVLPPRVIQRLTPDGVGVIVDSIGVEGGGEYAETFARDHVLTIQTS